MAAPPEDHRILSQKVATGLLMWLFFGISLTYLGYPLLLNLIVGAVSGGASIWIISWWHNGDLTSPELLDEGDRRVIRPISDGQPSRRRAHAPDIETAQQLRMIAEEKRRQNAQRPRHSLFAMPSLFRRSRSPRR
ncbi:hypothetical protein [Spirulina sp. CCNP1310]|uniref:hypothetical protein n=1 Tax=Spirulina sp. CCNP1310 TaxID=3110249 RepID=UPI002B20226C|nr:hypothetical protein [Spirulina sp. CCNP1310]